MKLSPLQALIDKEASLLDLIRIFDCDKGYREMVRPVLISRLRDLEFKTGCATGWESLA